jgi:hypothetical protein
MLIRSGGLDANVQVSGDFAEAETNFGALVIDGAIFVEAVKGFGNVENDLRFRKNHFSGKSRAPNGLHFLTISGGF